MNLFLEIENWQIFQYFWRGEKSKLCSKFRNFLFCSLPGLLLNFLKWLFLRLKETFFLSLSVIPMNAKELFRFKFHSFFQISNVYYRHLQVEVSMKPMKIVTQLLCIFVNKSKVQYLYYNVTLSCNITIYFSVTDETKIKFIHSARFSEYLMMFPKNCFCFTILSICNSKLYCSIRKPLSIAMNRHISIYLRDTGIILMNMLRLDSLFRLLGTT